ncbi:hypothetical protein LAZ67_2002627 [Cordylochernes scorpioides]|uniref:Retrovirus-related Pol polyprotein from transposon TNT 1-94 n=1 Tax=Cordylochernes scorpioides TaxID=51811 RepID=A0ABY6K5D2_9ARAC|nr:hypothetical protein LAZ67_2002627 [Cordylochernes scorpioides]
MAAVSAITAVVEKLNGQNYRSWKYNIKMLLIEKGLWDVMFKDEDTQDAKLKAQKDRVLAVIALSINTEHQIHIIDCSSPQNAWKNLEQVFEPKSRSRKLQLKKQFVNIKLQTGESMLDYLNRLKICTDHLKEAGAEVDDQDIAYSMLSGLPDSFDTLVMSFGNVEDSDFTSNKVRNTLLTEYERRSAREGASSGLGEALNFSKDDTRKTSRKQGVKCYRCSKIGHIAKDCRSSINRDYKADKSYSRKKDYFKSPSENMLMAFNAVSSEDEFILDSGATHHVYTGTQDVTLNDVLFVPQARRNLLSVSQTEDKGKHIKICNHKARVFSDNRVICVASNLNGLYIVRVDSFAGSRYFLTFTDDFSRRVTVYFLKHKDQVIEYFDIFRARAERETGHKIKRLRTDNGLEYCNKNFKQKLESLGIKHELTNSYSPQQNGVSERLNRSLLDMARASMHNADLPQIFWAESVNCAAYIKNRSLCSALDNKVPEEIWLSRKVSVRHFKIFGALAYAHIPKQKRKKFDRRAKRCILVGYSTQSKGYRLWDNDSKQVFITKHARFDENKLPDSSISLKFWFHILTAPTEIPSIVTVGWVREFKNGRTDVHDEPRAGRPSVSDETIAKVEAAMLEDRRVTVRKLCDLVPDVSKTTIDKILREHLEEFLDSIVTGDVTWVHYTTPETKEQSKQWKHTSSPKPPKFKQTLSAGKLIATVFWDRKGLLLCDFMRRGTTINFDRYCETLKQLRRAIQNKRRGMLTKGVRSHHDNARPHTAHQTTALVEEFGWELVSHPPYSPDVAPSDFHFLPELKKNLGGTQFQDDDELEEAVLGFIPPSLRVKDPVGNSHSQRAIFDLQKRLLHARILGCHSNIRFLSKTIKQLACIISQAIPPNQLTLIISNITAEVKLLQKNIRIRHDKKLRYWSVKFRLQLHDTDHSSNLVNLSSTVLSPQETTLLSKGLKFRPVSRPDPLKIISAVEAGIRSLNNSEKYKIRHTVSNILSLPSTQPRASPLEFDIIRKLRQKNHLAIMQSDKGSQTVIMNTTDYKEKLQVVLADISTFKPISAQNRSTIYSSVRKELNRLKRNQIISPEEHKSFLPDTATESYIYGLPKLHKPGIPLRPIVAHFLSPMAPVAKFISSFLSSLLKGTPSLTSISSTSTFINDVHGTPPCPSLVMVSFDVVSLYPSLPHDLIIDSLRSVGTRLEEHRKNISRQDEKSAIYQHIRTTNHSFDLANPSVHYSRIHNKQQRLTLEALVSQGFHAINRHIDLPESYQSLFP